MQLATFYIKPGHFGGVFTGFKAGLQGPVALCVDAKDRLWVSAGMPSGAADAEAIAERGMGDTIV